MKYRASKHHKDSMKVRSAEKHPWEYRALNIRVEVSKEMMASKG